MGAFASRQNAGVEEIDINTTHAYRYPPKTGSYFGSHFIMGGERFDTPQPEAYLFGENADLNFLGNRPTPFPYPAPQANEPTKTLKSLVNIRKESLRFLRVTDETEAEKLAKLGAGDQPDTISTKYNIEFTFDSDVRCAITIYYFCTEEVTANGIVYSPRDPTMNSETYQYKKGANQQFSQISHVFDPSFYTEDELNYNMDKEIMPIVIQCVAEEGEDPKQSHITMAVVEKNSDATYTLKPLKQKQFVDGLCYLLQEIYGIENKNAEYCKNANDDEIEDNGSECVICMCDIRDTLILPCRHLCLCNSCADSLRYQANNCPICRAPFRALLQIRALRKSTNLPPTSANTNSHTQDSIPQGYEAVSLIEALNGPSAPPPPIPVTLAMPTAPSLPMTQPLAAVGSQDAMTSPTLKVPNDSIGRCLFGSSSSLRCQVTTEDSAAQTDCPLVPLGIVTDNGSSTPEISLSMILPEALEKVVGEMAHKTEAKKLQSRLPSQEKAHLVQPHDTIRMVNEATSNDTSEDPSQLTETQSLLEVGPLAVRLVKSESKVISRSTPDSLHLCDKKDANGQHSDTDTQAEDGPSGGDESDYYTPEDPSTTILTEHLHKESQTAELEKEHGKPKMILPSFIESVSLPGTPQSHASNRSSGDSFSSTASTRLLLPNQSQETLSED